MTVESRRVGRVTRNDYAFAPAYDAATTTYVSYWLRDNARGHFLPHHLLDYYRELGDRAGARLATVSQAGSTVAPRPGQVVIGTVGDSNDVWGQEPNALVALPGLSPVRPCELGLAMNEIVAWKYRFADSPDCTYKLVFTDRNCSGVAVRALVAGGADHFAALGGNPSKGTLFFTPNNAATYVNSVRRGIILVGHMLTRIRGYCLVLPPPDGADLLSVDEFKGRSSAMGQDRSRRLRAIDAALAKYHALTWDADYPEKMGEFVTVIENAHDQIRASHGSSQAAALRALTLRVLEVVQQLATRAFDPWDDSPVDPAGDSFEQRSLIGGSVLGDAVAPAGPSRASSVSAPRARSDSESTTREQPVGTTSSSYGRKGG